MKRKMKIPDISPKQWEDREKAKIFEWLRKYFTQRAVFGESVLTYNEDFFACAIKILQDEIRGDNQ